MTFTKNGFEEKGEKEGASGEPGIDSWRYDPARDLDQGLVDRLKNFPREPDMLIYGIRSFLSLLIRGWMRLYHRMEIRGRENLPKEESYVMVANHSSHLDVVCLLSALPLRRLHCAFPAAAKDYFFVKFPRLFLSVVTVNALPFDRRDNPRESLDLCRRLLLNQGNILVLFPEGTRSVTGEIGEFKTGIGWLLAGTNIPVLPCHISGGYNAWAKGKWLPRPGKLRLTIGTPRRYGDLPEEKATVNHIRNDLREAVLGLAVVKGETNQAQ